MSNVKNLNIKTHELDVFIFRKIKTLIVETWQRFVMCVHKSLVEKSTITGAYVVMLAGYFLGGGRWWTKSLAARLMEYAHCLTRCTVCVSPVGMTSAWGKEVDCLNLTYNPKYLVLGWDLSMWESPGTKDKSCWAITNIRSLDGLSV